METTKSQTTYLPCPFNCSKVTMKQPRPAKGGLLFSCKEWWLVIIGLDYLQGKRLYENDGGRNNHSNSKRSITQPPYAIYLIAGNAESKSKRETLLLRGDWMGNTACPCEQKPMESKGPMDSKFFRKRRILFSKMLTVSGSCQQGPVQDSPRCDPYRVHAAARGTGRCVRSKAASVGWPRCCNPPPPFVACTCCT